MQTVSYLDALRETTERMADGGVFLSVGGAKPNTLTIGWGSVGFYWNRPVFTAVVRPQRHSYKLLLDQGEFTVSVPTHDPLLEQLAFCGSASGADVDKFSGHGITAARAIRVGAPIIKECGLHFECVVRLLQDMTPDRMEGGVLESCYPARDMHTMFFGEIVNCYRTDEN